MYKFLVLAAAVVLCVSSAPHHGHEHDGQSGGKGQSEELDASSPEVLARLKRALEMAKWTQSGVKKINKATSEKVEGTMYTFDFDANDGEHCTATWAEEPWVSKDPEHITVDCHFH